MHILCWDSTVLGKEGVKPEEQLPFCSGILLTVIRLWASMKCIWGAAASKGDWVFFTDIGFSQCCKKP